MIARAKIRTRVDLNKHSSLPAFQRDELKGWYRKFIQTGNTGASDKRRKTKATLAMMRKLCISLWHARVNDKNFDYALIVTGH